MKVDFLGSSHSPKMSIKLDHSVTLHSPVESLDKLHETHMTLNSEKNGN